MKKMELKAIDWSTIYLPKVLIVGAGRQGKTTLLRYILQQCHGNQQFETNGFFICDKDGLTTNLDAEQACCGASTALVTLQCPTDVRQDLYHSFDFYVLMGAGPQEEMKRFHKRVLSGTCLTFTEFEKLADECFQEDFRALVIQNPTKWKELQIEELLFCTKAVWGGSSFPSLYGQARMPTSFYEEISLFLPADLCSEVWHFVSHGDCDFCKPKI